VVLYFVLFDPARSVVVSDNRVMQGAQRKLSVRRHMGNGPIQRMLMASARANFDAMYNSFSKRAVVPTFRHLAFLFRSMRGHSCFPKKRLGAFSRYLDVYFYNKTIGSSGICVYHTDALAQGLNINTFTAIFGTDIQHTDMSFRLL
jgi:hypothetical protein